MPRRTNQQVKPADEPTTDEPTTDEPTTDEPTHLGLPLVLADVFTAAWSDALELRDVTTGALPAIATDAVAVSFRALRGNVRSSLPASLSAESMAAAMVDPSSPDVGLMVAVGALQQVIATAAVKPASTPRVAVPADPILSAALTIGTLRYALRIAEQAHVDVLDAVNARLDEGTSIDAARVQKVAMAAQVKPGKQSSGSGGTHAPGRDLAALILAAVTEATGPLTIAEVKRAIGSTGGAVDNRWSADNIDGLTTSTVDHDGKQSKVFALA